jgi:hypothetical protein
MVDIVVNHNAWPGPPEAVDFSALNPFNRPSDYHLPYCAVDYSDLTNDVSVHLLRRRALSPLYNTTAAIHQPRTN